ncbi:hypothetical protein OHB26_39330 (plasmid) [Nocardia sp. NBC_01503]|nr:hypothetical protein [Nocardia sp. NBC_01503]WTL36715.1 hypothetical protein OHB26_39245 [Nocardia sp. NBC_01503]WTL36732.1 hypothetical protein OHB26_39330 [Nocardia sp. NBC_01503]
MAKLKKRDLGPRITGAATELVGDAIRQAALTDLRARVGGERS